MSGSIVKSISAISLGLVLTCSGCDRLVTPEDRPPASPVLTDLDYVQIDYDKYQVVYRPTTSFVSSNIFLIELGSIDSSGFAIQDSIVGVYDGSERVFRSEIKGLVQITSPGLTISIRVRYHRTSGIVSDVDTTLSVLTYPYPGTEVLWDKRDYALEDIDVTDSLIVGLENDRFVMFNRNTAQVSYRNVGCYEALTIVDGRYIYYDDIGWSIYRYDMVEGTSVRFVYHPQSFAYLTMGLEYFDGSIWELFLQPGGTYLYRYERQTGAVIDSILMPPDVSRMTIHDNIVYMKSLFHHYELKRFDLTTRSFLPPFKVPTIGGEGIRIRDGYFYFNGGGTISRFPLNELFEHGPMSSLATDGRLESQTSNNRLRRDDLH